MPEGKEGTEMNYADKLLRNGKAMILAYDHGLEHGSADFNETNANPEFVFDIALNAGFTGIAVHKGIAERYYTGKYRKIPLVLKLNGKTNLVKDEPCPGLICTVKEAIDLGAAAVGYTIYLGSRYEAKMLSEFSGIQYLAHQNGLAVVGWIYPRGGNVKDETSREMLAYAARIGLELGADMIKIKYNGNPDDLKWCVRCAGDVKVLIAGGLKVEEEQLYKQVTEIMGAGATGLAIGRNVWQNLIPIKVCENLRKIVFGE